MKVIKIKNNNTKYKDKTKKHDFFYLEKILTFLSLPKDHRELKRQNTFISKQTWVSSSSSSSSPILYLLSILVKHEGIKQHKNQRRVGLSCVFDDSHSYGTGKT